MTEKLTERLECCYTGAVFDVMRELELPEGLLPRELKSLDPEKTVAGPVFPILGRKAILAGTPPQEAYLQYRKF